MLKLLELKDGLSPRRTIYLCVKGQREIPLTRVGQPMTLEKLKHKQPNWLNFLQKIYY
jgi:hypothetical protein